MPTYVLISQKGGVGKSTLACNLATVAGEAEHTIILDRDKQKSTTKWWERRQEIEGIGEAPELIDLQGASLTAAVAGLRSQAGALFIDTRPAVEEPEAEAARCADLAIVPVKPTMKDVEAVLPTLDMLARVKTAAVIVVNSARNEARAAGAQAALRKFNVPICPIYIADRTAYHDADIEGRAVTEMRGTAARNAANELRSVWAWIKEASK